MDASTQAGDKHVVRLGEVMSPAVPGDDGNDDGDEDGDANSRFKT